ncbi:streptomycin 6-kinase [Leifsonia sp. 98AMF]|uniref:aminoglycoside phosphotransferase family protein n=1 Tax=unclassified Leifsonia TaxID=2663824 RepID=UPI00087A0E95|nr:MULTISPECIES: aminoglycoside phosphotransferase family protein [unclassified Leifsonia]SDH14624.1 streptomycin 6-kinase [Leifsonia sp. 197AMF]SDJ23800.1 streptomycin 6-kinase [Leifsonia sp. 466MF]SDK59586.1 streptomycin 6-kinase [Leifsonia sp. 157MF]SDN45436.1 streptomycin 6-kinase [Leifsonia sp. 509MF]SEN65475.1 streptomycin 6-kinase [Leifsonia sp. 467MF]
MTDLDAVLAPWRERWRLDPDGEAFTTPSSVLQLVRRRGEPLFLKVATAEEERAGATVIAWWSGEGAAAVVEADADAVLLERATGARDLGQLSRSGAAGDDEATRILCRAGRRLHAAGTGPRPDGLFDLRRWFRDLLQRGDAAGDDLFVVAARVAEGLLRHPDGDVVLHGDLHHGNVLDFGPRGWLAIDPKPLHGDPGFDAANILCNPDPATALAPGRLERAVAVIAAETGQSEDRVLRWALAWGALSTVWAEQDGAAHASAAGVAQRARTLLGL